MRADLIGGRNPVLEALRAGRRLQVIMVARGEKRGSVLEILRLAREAGIPVQEVSREELDRRAGELAHQGVVAVAAPWRPATVEAVLEAAQRRGQPALVVVAAEVQDPRNLGALIRCAEAAGAHGLIIPRHRAAGVTPATVKASAGAVEFLPVAEVTNLARCLDELKGMGLWVFGADAGGALLYHEADWRVPAVLVVGSEGRGIPRLVREKCDFLVRIPMWGRINSLNVAAAAAILLFEAARQRHSGGSSGTRVDG